MANEDKQTDLKLDDKATDQDTGADKATAINDIDTPVNQALLMGEEDGPGDDNQDEGEGDEPDIEETTEADVAVADKGMDKGEKPGFVTQGRFNQVYANAKTLEEENAALKAQLEGKGPAKEAEKPVDLKSLRDQEADIEDRIEQALMDGDDDKKKELRKDLRAIRGQIDNVAIELAVKTERTVAKQEQEESNFLKTAAAMVEKYPVLDAKTGDPKAVAMVVKLRDANIAQGMSWSDALKSAADDVAPLFTKAEEGDGEDNGADKGADKRTEKAVVRGIETAKKIPPLGGGVGNRAQSTESPQAKISQAEWDKMPQTQRDKLLSEGIEVAA